MEETNKKNSSEHSSHRHSHSSHRHSNPGHTHSHSSSGHSKKSSHKSKSSKKKSKFKHSLRRPMSHLVSVLLTFVTFFFFSLIAILSGAFNNSYIIKAATDENYLNQLLDAQYTEATAMASDYNLPGKIFNNVITQDSLKAHMTEYVEAVVSGSSKAVDISAMQKTLTSNIEITVKDSGAEFDEKAKNTTTEFVLSFGEKYLDLLEIKNLDLITSFKVPFIIVFIICEILLALLIPIFSLLIDKSHRNSHKSTRQLAYSFIGAGMLTFAIPFITKFTGMYETLKTSREYIYNFFISYFDHVMNVWMLFAVIPLAMGLGFVVWTRYRKNKLKIKT